MANIKNTMRYAAVMLILGLAGCATGQGGYPASVYYAGPITRPWHPPPAPDSGAAMRAIYASPSTSHTYSLPGRTVYCTGAGSVTSCF